MENSSNLLYTWSFDDRKERSPLWYIIALSCMIGLIVWGLVSGMYGMSIVVLLLGGFFYFLENNSEDTVQVGITELGISIANSFYDFARIEGFNFVYDGNEAIYLRLHIKKRGISYMNVQLNNTIATQLRPILTPYIPEDAKQDLTLLEKISHMLKL